MNTPSSEARQDRLLTYGEAAALLSVSKRTLQRWIDARRLPVVVLSPRVKRIKRSDLRLLVHTSMAMDGLNGNVI